MDFYNGGSTSSTGSDSNSSYWGEGHELVRNDWVEGELVRTAFNASTWEGRAAMWDPAEYPSLISEARNSKLFRKEWERCMLAFRKDAEREMLETKGHMLKHKLCRRFVEQNRFVDVEMMCSGSSYSKKRKRADAANELEI